MPAKTRTSPPLQSLLRNCTQSAMIALIMSLNWIPDQAKTLETTIKSHSLSANATSRLPYPRSRFVCSSTFPILAYPGPQSLGNPSERASRQPLHHRPQIAFQRWRPFRILIFLRLRQPFGLLPLSQISKTHPAPDRKDDHDILSCIGYLIDQDDPWRRLC